MGAAHSGTGDCRIWRIRFIRRDIGFICCSGAILSFSIMRNHWYFFYLDYIAVSKDCLWTDWELCLCGPKNDPASQAKVTAIRSQSICCMMCIPIAWVFRRMFKEKQETTYDAKSVPLHPLHILFPTAPRINHTTGFHLNLVIIKGDPTLS